VILLLCVQELENKPNHELLSLLKQFDGVTNQAFILRILFTREGAGFRIDGDPIVERMEMVINRAGVHKKWEIVRLLAATLGKLVDSLAPSITTILVRGKQVRVCVFVESGRFLLIVQGYTGVIHESSNKGCRALCTHPVVLHRAMFSEL